jgi:PAS domain S-box-containing protein
MAAPPGSTLYFRAVPGGPSVVGIIQDVADASARDESFALLDALWETAPLGLAYFDLDLRYRRINAVLAAINGLPVEQHLGRRPSEVLPELGPQLEAMFGRILAQGQAVRELEVTGETPAAPGVSRHWLASYFPVREEDEYVGVLGLVVEVTSERHASVRADEATRQSAFVDAELRALYSALPVGVAFLSPDLRFQRVNETLARMNGRPVADHLGASPEEVLGAPGARLHDALRRVMETREPLELEVSAPAEEAPTPRTFEAVYFPIAVGDDLLGLHVFPDGAGEEPFHPHRRGLDHVSFGCPDRAELEKWQRRLDELGVAHGDISDASYGSGLSFKDPDGIALEFFAPPAG